jgi:hypothetical protein
VSARLIPPLSEVSLTSLDRSRQRTPPNMGYNLRRMRASFTPLLPQSSDLRDCMI